MNRRWTPFGNGNISVTQGPFAETGEQLGWFVLIEVRPIKELDAGLPRPAWHQFFGD